MSQIHIDIHDPSLEAELLKLIQSDYPVFMMQLPPVFALVAPSSFAGVEALNRSKSRLPGKHYGSAIGNLQNFLSIAHKELLPEYFLNNSRDLSFLNSSFIRIHTASPETETPSIHKGTHQGLLLADGKDRDIFKFIENACGPEKPNPLFGGLCFNAPICTSANDSGDSKGAITDYDQALRFAEKRKIPLIITNSDLPKTPGKGSYPIFYFFQNTFSKMRPGHGQFEIIANMPKCIEQI